MDDFSRTLEKNLQDKQFKKEWDDSELEYQLQCELIQARAESGMTQKELAEKSGVRQSNISRIETGNAAPKLSTLQALAHAMGKELKISFM